MKEKKENLSLVINRRLKNSPQRIRKGKSLNMDSLKTLREVLFNQQDRAFKLTLSGLVIFIIPVLIFTFTGFKIAYFSFFGIALALIGGVQLYKIETLLDKVNHQIMRNK